MREELVTAVELALAASKPSPSNEQETCFRIIDPLLKAMGYGYQEIKIQDRDNAKQKPDYSVLPNDPELTWFLEAKAWDVTLNDDHAIQAVNYANTQGKRWVVLSNGRDWRLYDNHTLGTVEVKRACASQLSDEAFISFLEALSKTSIEQRKLEDFVRNERLYTCLSSQMTRPDSDIVKSILRTLKLVTGLGTITGADVVGFWRDYAAISPRAIAAVQTLAQSALDTVGSTSAEITADEGGVARSFALGSLRAADITGAKIKSLTLPEGRAMPVAKWNQLTVQVALFVLEQGTMPAPPFFMSQRTKSPLVAMAGSSESRQMREPLKLPPPYSNWLVEGHFSAVGHERASVNLLRAAGIEPTTLQIVI